MFDLIVCLFGSHVLPWDIVFLECGGRSLLLALHSTLAEIRHGFKLGFCPTRPLKPAKKNKPSADQHASIIDEYPAKEVLRGRVAGPFDSLPSLPG